MDTAAYYPGLSTTLGGTDLKVLKFSVPYTADWFWANKARMTNKLVLINT